MNRLGNWVFTCNESVGLIISCDSGLGRLYGEIDDIGDDEDSMRFLFMV